MQLILFKPVIQFDTLGGFDGDSPSEVLGQMTLVDGRLLHHLPLGYGVLVEVLADGLSHEGLVSPEVRGRNA